MSKHTRKQSKSRAVSYQYAGSFDEAAMEATLRRAVTLGHVTQFDTGRGTIVWFDGPPGEGLRSVRDEVELVLAAGGPWRMVTYRTQEGE